jgi:hypothetical protein
MMDINLSVSLNNNEIGDDRGLIELNLRLSEYPTVVF